MMARARPPEDRPDDADRSAAASERSPDDHVRQVTRRLHGVPSEQLADERRTEAKRTATIDARKRRR